MHESIATDFHYQESSIDRENKTGSSFRLSIFEDGKNTSERRFHYPLNFKNQNIGGSADSSGTFTKMTTLSSLKDSVESSFVQFLSACTQSKKFEITCFTIEHEASNWLIIPNSSLGFFTIVSQNESPIKWIRSIETDTNIAEHPKTNLFSKVDSFSELLDGWGSHHSLAPTEKAITEAKSFIGLLSPVEKYPHVSVAEDGEINFSWISDTTYIDVGVYGDGEIEFYVKSESAGVDETGSVSSSTDSLPNSIKLALKYF